jgi:hypothetical protein
MVPTDYGDNKFTKFEDQSNEHFCVQLNIVYFEVLKDWRLIVR